MTPDHDDQWDPRTWFEDGWKIADLQQRYEYYAGGLRREMPRSTWAWAWAGIGLVFFTQGKKLEADDAFGRAITLDPQLSAVIETYKGQNKNEGRQKGRPEPPGPAPRVIQPPVRPEAQPTTDLQSLPMSPDPDENFDPRKWFEEGLKIEDVQQRHEYYAAGLRRGRSRRAWPWAWAGIGLVSFTRGNQNEADDAFRRAVAFDPRIAATIETHTQGLPQKEQGSAPPPVPLPANPVPSPDRDPQKMPDADRAYYRATWGFDPVADSSVLGSGGRRLESFFPLDQDPPLAAAGVTIGARVDWQGEKVRNRIVFRRGEKEAAVECTHTVVYAGSVEQALTFATDEATAAGKLSGADLAWMRRGGGPVALPPWEHFAALKSYVAAITEMGLGAMFRAAIGPTTEDFQDAPETPEAPFGFNATMQAQVIAALKKVACLEYLDASIIIRLFRSSEVMDHWQDEIFQHQMRYRHTRQTAPSLPWEMLRREWRARRIARKMTEAGGATYEMGGGDSHPPFPGEVWPRGPLCARDFPWQFFDNPEINLPAVIRGRMQDFLQTGFQKMQELGSRDLELLNWLEEQPELPTGVLVQMMIWSNATEVGWSVKRGRKDFPFEKIIEIAEHGSMAITMEKIASWPETPPEILGKLARDTSGLYDLELASNPATPVSVLRKLVTEASSQILANLARNPALPVDCMKHLAQQPAAEIREAVAGAPHAPPDVLEQLARDQSEEVRLEVAQNPHITPEKVFKTIGKSDERVCVILAENPHTPLNILEEMAKHPIALVRQRIAQHPATPIAILEVLGNDADAGVRESVAFNPNTPAYILEHLGADTHHNVLCAVVYNAHTPPGILLSLFNTGDPEMVYRAAQNAGFPLDHVEQVPRLSRTNINIFARREDLPSKWMENFCTHPDFTIRLLMAIHPRLPSALLERLAHDVQPSIRAIVEARRARDAPEIHPVPGEILSPGEILWFLASHEEEKHRFAISWDGDGSREYREWFTTEWGQYGKDWRPPLLSTWCYITGVFSEVERDGWDSYHLALHGLRSVTCGQFPCIYLGKAREQY